jgi:DNA helicase-2/ATP-dependent DNA helicase PcrA
MSEANYPPYLEPLNPEQRQAVLHSGKPLLILAGAGSGKTRVITTKIAWLIGERGMDPRSILAVTFTNKAAKEMAERAKQIDPRAEGAMLRTFHSFGAWFLRRNGGLANLDSSFVIYDDDDAVSLLSTIMDGAPKAEVKQYAHSISRAKDFFLSPSDPLLAAINDKKKFRDIYTRYEKRMAEIGNVDFGDLIKKPVEILRGQPEVARRFHERFRVIMVDEYQDANVAQFHLLKELCGQETYVCVVGDDDQSIYKFRGAEVKNILEFPDRFNGADIIRLERNYRSTEPILNVAASVVDYNRGRLGKTLRAEKGKGPEPVLAYLPDQDEETAYCADKIESAVKKKETSWSDWAILYRTNAQSLGFETYFLRKGIPYRVVGSLKFYEREEIKDALALLSFLVNPRDEVAFRRVVNKPARGVGAVTVDKIVEGALGSGEQGVGSGEQGAGSGEWGVGNGDLLEAARSMAGELPKKASSGIKEFIRIIDTGQTLLNSPVSPCPRVRSSSRKTKSDGLVSGEGLSVCITRLVNDSGLVEHYMGEDEYAAANRISNLQELVNAAIDYPQSREGLLEFLENIELDRSLGDTSENNNRQDAVTLITFHNTKGLEFKRVIMTGLEHGIFPREDKRDEELEEERRLFYVGATRAMDELYLTTCAQRRMFGKTMPTQPSLFVREIDRSCLQIDDRVSGIRQPIARKTLNPYNLNSADVKANEVEKRAGWKRGQRLLHEDHGFGAVMEVRDSEDGPVVKVRFDSGKETRFLSDYQGRAYEKVSEDY